MQFFSEGSLNYPSPLLYTDFQGILCMLYIQVNEGMREKENSERLEWLQIHVDLHHEEKSIQEKITFNSLTNSVGPRR